jgi:hypothetical protein
MTTVTPGSGQEDSGAGTDSRWSTIRYALGSWSLTARLCLVGLFWTGCATTLLLWLILR